mgnify:FL=1
MSQPQGYSDTIVIECNRESSVEATSGNDENPALWTSRAGDGIKLDIGDEVSLHSAYISELGAQTGKIEIKGETIGTNPSNAYYTISASITEMIDQNREQFEGSASMLSRDIPDKYWKTSVSLTQPTFELTDNEIHVVIHPYKNMNGEFACSLPRRHLGQAMNAFNHTTSAQANASNLEHLTSYLPMRAFDFNGFSLWAEGGNWRYKVSDLGATFYPLNEFQWFDGDIHNQHHTQVPGVLTGDDSYLVTGLTTPGATTRGNIQAPVCPNQQGLFSQKVKSDNSRYFLFTMDNIYRNSEAANDDNRLSGLGGNAELAMDFAFTIPQAYIPSAPAPGFWEDTQNGLPENYAPFNSASYAVAQASGTQRQYLDPCRMPFTQVKELVTMKATTGFNAPKDVSVELTEQLNNQKNLEPIYYDFTTNQKVNEEWAIDAGATRWNAPFPDVSLANNGSRTSTIPITFETETPCYKPRNCATHYLMNETTWNEYRFANSCSTLSGSAITQASATEVYKYMSSYQHIGVKRPELFVKGRELNGYIKPIETNGGWSRFVSTSGTVRGIPDDEQFVATNLLWTQDNFDKLIALFDAEKLYPELFDKYYGQANFIQSRSSNTISASIQLSVSNSRFLHMNTRDNGSAISAEDPSQTTGLAADGTTFDPFRVQFPRHILGSDNYEWDGINIGKHYGPGDHAKSIAVLPSNTASGTEAGIVTSASEIVNTSFTGYNNFLRATQKSDSNSFDGTWTNSSNMSSAPFFFDYNPDLSEANPFTANGGKFSGERYDNLAYGFGRKFRNLGVDYIALSTRWKVGGIQRHFFNGSGSEQGKNWKTNSSGTIGLAGRSLGWDHHFTAYGCPVILPCNGAQDVKGTSFDEISTAQIPVDGVVRGCDAYQNQSGTGLSASAGTGTYGKWFAGGTDGANNFYNPHTTTSAYMKIDWRNTKTSSSACNTPFYAEKFMNKIYIGANQPSIVYDDAAEQRFQIKYLHTPEYIGNALNAGAGAGNLPFTESASDQSEAVTATTGNDTAVYKINKHLSRYNYNPDQSPYTNIYATKLRGIRTSDTFSKEEHNALVATSTEFFEGMEFNTIFDSMSGISLAEWAMPKELWTKSLMGIMGFAYEQFHHDTPNNPQTRLSNSTNLNNMNIVTTNSDPSLEDVVEYDRNIFGESTFNISIPTNRASNGISAAAKSGEGAGSECAVWQPITITADSFLITAKNLPTKVKRPYYTIHSDIIGRSRYVGGGGDGGQTMPIVAVISKESGYGDYFFSGVQPQTTFTITHPRTITAIRCNVKDPDGTDSKCGPSSAVIYQIKKQRKVDLTPVATILSQHQQMTPQQQALDIAYRQLMAMTAPQTINPTADPVGTVFPAGTFQTQPATGMLQEAETELQQAILEAQGDESAMRAIAQRVMPKRAGPPLMSAERLEAIRVASANLSQVLARPASRFEVPAEPADPAEVVAQGLENTAEQLLKAGDHQGIGDMRGNMADNREELDRRARDDPAITEELRLQALLATPGISGAGMSVEQIRRDVALAQAGVAGVSGDDPDEPTEPEPEE